MELLNFAPKGYFFLTSGGDVDEIARIMSAAVRRNGGLPSGQIPKFKGAVKAFSFHWSNAQAAWDVIAAKDFPWGLDGAEFILFIGPDAISPVGKLWSLTEMRYVAKKLTPHPGFASAVRGAGLRGSLIRLAHAKPELRPHLLPLLKD